jgi:hypothetical protein
MNNTSLSSNINPCDELCPLEGVPCISLPSSAVVQDLLLRGYGWVCHGNPRTYCASTLYYAAELGISPPDLTKISTLKEAGLVNKGETNV